MWVAAAVRRIWELANQEIGPEKDFTELIRVLERHAGVEVKGGRHG
jgi:hypothetical protein